MDKKDFDIKLKQLKWKADKKAMEVKNWARKNPEQATIVLGAVIGGAGYFGKSALKNINLRKQEAVKVLYCYDRSLGHYWRLRRELTNREWLEIDRRKRAGEKLADILESMKVLK